MLGTDQLLPVSYTNASCTGDHLKLSVLAFLTVSSKLLAMQLRSEKCNFLMLVVSFSYTSFLASYFQVADIFQFGFQTQDNNDVLAYWLSNASTLLLLLQRTLKASGAAGMAPQRHRSSATLFGRMTQVKHSF